MLVDGWGRTNGHQGQVVPTNPATILADVVEKAAQKKVGLPFCGRPTGQVLDAGLT